MASDKYRTVDFIPASRVPRLANYRQPTSHEGAIGGGVRIGMPEDPMVNLDEDPNAQEEILGEDDLPPTNPGTMTAIGAILVREGQVSLQDIAAAGRGGRPEPDLMPPMEDHIAYTDRYEEGTPGGGDPHAEVYNYRREAERLTGMADRAIRSNNIVVAESLLARAEAAVAAADAIEAELSGFDGYGSVNTGFGTTVADGDPYRGW